MQTIPVLWTNDDIMFGRAEAHRRQLEFLDRLGIPGVFFVIPSAGDSAIGNDVELMRLVDQSRDKGHEYYQHGHMHTAFESGVPELWMLEFSPPTKEAFDTNRFEIESKHTIEALTEMIDKGRRVWRKAFGDDSPGYRPGWGAYCSNLYRALKLLGFEWVSSRIPFKTSWIWNQRRWDFQMEFPKDARTEPYDLFGIREYPLAGDYAFQVPNDAKRIEQMADLGLAEFDEYHRRGHPMLMVSHHHGLERTGEYDGCQPMASGTGYAVHERLIPAIMDSGRATFLNMSQFLEHEKAACMQ